MRISFFSFLAKYDLSDSLWINYHRNISTKHFSKNYLQKQEIWILVIPSDIVTSCTYAREKQYFLAAPYIHIHAHTYYMKWPRSASSWNNRIPYTSAVIRRVEKSRDAASDSQRRHSLWDTRIRKNTRARGGDSCLARISSLFQSRPCHVLFLFRDERLTRVRASWQIFAAGIAPRDYIEHVWYTPTPSHFAFALRIRYGEQSRCVCLSSRSPLVLRL